MFIELLSFERPIYNFSLQIWYWTVNLTLTSLSTKPFIRLNHQNISSPKKQNKLQKYFQKWVYS